MMYLKSSLGIRKRSAISDTNDCVSLMMSLTQAQRSVTGTLRAAKSLNEKMRVSSENIGEVSLALGYVLALGHHRFASREDVETRSWSPVRICWRYHRFRSAM
jgi:hypothetical protein